MLRIYPVNKRARTSQKGRVFINLAVAGEEEAIDT